MGSGVPIGYTFSVKKTQTQKRTPDTLLVKFTQAAKDVLLRKLSENPDTDKTAIVNQLMAGPRFGQIAERYIAETQKRTGLSRDEVIEEALLSSWYKLRNEETGHSLIDGIADQGKGQQSVAE